MRLDLVTSRGNLGCLEKFLGIFEGEVANPDTPDLALFDQFLERGPGVGDRDICHTESFGDGIDWSECFVGMLEGHGPVDEVEIQIISLEVAQRLIESLFNMVWVVMGVPQFAGYLQ